MARTKGRTEICHSGRLACFLTLLSLTRCFPQEQHKTEKSTNILTTDHESTINRRWWQCLMEFRQRLDEKWSETVQRTREIMKEWQSFENNTVKVYDNRSGHESLSCEQSGATWKYANMSDPKFQVRFDSWINFALHRDFSIALEWPFSGSLLLESCHLGSLSVACTFRNEAPKSAVRLKIPMWIPS